MAPRRSSGAGSGGVGSSGDGSDSDGSDASIWLADSQIYGWGFTYGYAVADIVIIGIYLVALFGIAVWAMGTPRRSQATKSVLGWKKYGIAMCLILTLHGFNFAQRIIQTDGPSVANVYFLLMTIIEDVLYPATTWVLFTIYSLLFYCSIDSDENKRARHRGFFKAHCILCVILTTLWLVLLAYDILRTVDAVSTNGFEPSDLQTDPFIWIVYDLDVAFQALLLAASIEVLLVAIWRLITTRRHGGESSRTAMRFLVFVAIPFFIWRLFFLAYAASTEFPSSQPETWGAAIAFDIITGACAIFVFTGIVMVSKGLGKVEPRPWNGDQGFAQQPPPPLPPFGYAPAPAAALGQPYAQQYPHYGPVSPISPVSTYPQELHNQAQGVPEMPVRHAVQHEVPP